MALEQFYRDRAAFNKLQQGYQDNALARQAGGMLAGGDATGARNVLYRGGALDSGLEVQSKVLDPQHKKEVEFAGNLAAGLAKRLGNGTPEEAERAWQEADVWAGQQGMSDHMPSLRAMYDKMGPQAFTHWLGNKAEKEYKYFQNETGIYGVNTADPADVVTSKAFPAKPQVIGDYVYYPDNTTPVPGGTPGINAGADYSQPRPANGPTTPVPGGTPGINAGARYPTGTATRDTNGYTVPPPPPLVQGPMPERPQTPYREAISGIESGSPGGDYRKIGPVTRSGDRAYGRYQVMGANIPQWTQEVLGRAMTPQQFLADDKAQDVVFDAKFGGYVQQYGSPEEAASMWFTGKPQAQGANRRDVNGMTGARYVQQFSQNMAGGGSLQGSASGDDLSAAPQIPGYRVAGRVKGGANGETWTSDGKGFLVNRNGDVKPDPRSKSSGPGMSVPKAAGLTDLGGGFYQDKVGRIYQPNSVGVLTQTAGVTDGAVQKSIETVTGLNSALASVQKFEDAISALSPRDFGPLGNYTGDQAKFAAAKAAATELMMTMKSPAMFNLGVITGPDMQILEGVIEDPGKWGAMIRKNQIRPKLHSLGANIGSKYAMEREAFTALGGNADGLPRLYHNGAGRGATPGRPAAPGQGGGKPSNGWGKLTVGGR